MEAIAPGGPDPFERAPLLRFLTCGSVDDGKSTLIGRLLHDTGAVAADQLETLAADSRRTGTQNGALDLALLVDGLAAEREQGITIDVAYRFFGTARRRFIVADTPGHEQYTRNMVTGASTADLAIILMDARKGVLVQTRRHSFIAHLLGIRHLVLAVNKMDLVGHDEARFAALVVEYAAFARGIGIDAEVTAIPLSGLSGANVARRDPVAMPWWRGPTLLEHLETVPVDDGDGHGTGRGTGRERPFRMPVQLARRPHAGFRGISGLVEAGAVRPGDQVLVMPSGRLTRIAAIHGWGGDLPRAVCGQHATLSFADEVDCARGDVVCAADAPPEVADRFEADLVWMAEEPMLPGRSYLLRLATQTASAQLQPPRQQLDMASMTPAPARTLTLNAVGVVHLSTDRPLVFEPYRDNRALGGFILVDKISNATVAAGMIRFALRRAHNLHWQAMEVDRDARASLKGQRPAVLWFTGLSGAGKSTIANLVEKKLHARGRHTFLLDGDNVRHGLNRDLGFTAADRVENIRRIGEVAKLMGDAGLVVLTAFISPFVAERRMVREMLPPGEFVEIHIDTPLADAEKRDPKGLYAKARRGELANFTGIDSPYEPPEHPELRLDTTVLDPEAAADAVIRFLEAHANPPPVRDVQPGPPPQPDKSRRTPMADDMIEQIRSNPGFIAALDQSGGSTPGALKAYGIPEAEFAGDEAKMFALMHAMRVRVMTAPSFTGDKVVGAILFEKTMDGEAEGQPVPAYLRSRGIAPFLKIDKGLEKEADGVQLMKPIPGLDELLASAVKLGVVGTKERSVIARASESGIAAIVAQQFEIGAQVAAHGIVPILEPEVLIKNPEKARSEEILRDEIAKALDADRQGYKLMLKVTPPEQANLYADLMEHPRVVRIVALSGGYPRDEACAKVAANKGLIASFSRALLDDLRVSQDDATFDHTLAGVIDQIYRASAHQA